MTAVADPGARPYRPGPVAPPDEAAVCCPRCARPVTVVASRTKLHRRVPVLFCRPCHERRDRRPDWLSSDEPSVWAGEEWFAAVWADMLG